MDEFRKELEHLINKHSMENASKTPDFLLAEYLVNCLMAFDSVIEQREKWYGQNEEKESVSVSYPGEVHTSL